MDPNNVVGTPSAQPQPAPTAAATISAKLAAAPAPASQPEPNPMTMGPKKSSKGGIIAAILFALIAAGGVGFGVWAMMDGKTKEEQYNTQIDALKKTNSELMEKLAEDNTDAEDYLYLGELGIKIKKSENWQELVQKYIYYNDYPQAVDTFEIRESLDPGDGIYISIVASCDSSTISNGVCFAVDDKSVAVTQLVGELAPGSSSTLSEAFWNYFINPENYSTI